MSAASRSLVVLVVGLALLAGLVLVSDSPPELPPSDVAAAAAPAADPAALAARAERATRAILVDASPVAPDATPPRALCLRGSLAGPAPGFGAAWIVEAFRLTSSRDSVIEQRRVFVEARGEFMFEALAPGVWQVALVAPCFAWGPIVDLTGADSTEAIRLPVSGLGRLHVELIAGALWQRGARVRVELFALRGPAAEPALRLPVRILQRELRLGEPCMIESLVAGVFEVRASLLDADSEGGSRSFAVAEASLADRDVRVALSLPSSGDLWRLLCTITVAKARKNARFHLARKRGIGREAQSADSAVDATAFELADRAPTPAESAEFVDTFRHLLAQLDDEERRIVGLKLDQRSHADIAAECGCSERTVRRIVKRIEARLLETADLDAE